MILVFHGADQKLYSLEDTQENRNLINQYLKELGTPEKKGIPRQPRHDEASSDEEHFKKLREWFKLSWPATETIAERLVPVHGPQRFVTKRFDAFLLFVTEW